MRDISKQSVYVLYLYLVGYGLQKTCSVTVGKRYLFVAQEYVL